MHLQDKRLFYFSDSLYKYLEQAEGYALEVDLAELMDSVIQKVIDQKEDEIIDKKRLQHSSEKKKIIDSLLRNVKLYNDKASKKQLEKLRNEKMRKAIKNKEMPTVMDAYFYGIARRQGKWLGGIEDVQDQLSLFDEFGTEISEGDLLATDKEITVSLEKMIAIYLAKDLDGIEEFATGNYSGKLEDAMFLKRNLKMARRMDSLAHVRSMFFTVGAAHLPGDSGVINLLRSKGYRVEPVFSTAKIDPDEYTSQLAQAPWIKVEDERKTYQVEMPGKASDLNMFGDLIRMKFYMDITSLTYYMSGSTVLQKELDLEKAIGQLSSNIDAKILDKKLIQKGDMKGIESVMRADDNYYKAQYLVRDNVLYILLAGGEKKEVLEANDLKKFFESFVAYKRKPAPSSNQWAVFGLKEKAFTVELPGQPRRNEKIEKKAEGSEWKFTVYDYADESTGNYYMVQVRDIRPGYFLEGDSAYFSIFRDNLKNVIGNVTRDTVFMLNSFPAFSYEGTSTEGDLSFKTLTLTRGNRVYNLFAVGNMNGHGSEDLERFLHSITLTDYQKSAWKKEISPEGNFFTTAPAPVIEKTEDEGKEKIIINYVSYNSNNCISYHVIKNVFSTYYWTKNDTLLFNKTGLAYKDDADSVLSEKWVTNGKLKGKEWLISSAGSTNIKKFRQLVNGDTLYTILSFIPYQYINEKEQQQFFEDFRVIDEQPVSSIFQKKTAKLLADLQSKDSVVFEKASRELPSAVFEEEDRDLLHEALLKEYPDDDGIYFKVRQHISNRLRDIEDKSTVDFIRQNYPKLTGKKEAYKIYLLNVLAAYKTDYSYNSLKELILNDPPKTGDRVLSAWMMDSAKLNRTLFPEILSLNDNELLQSWLVSLTAQMIDSNIVTRDMLLSYEKGFLAAGDTVYTKLKDQPDDAFYDFPYVSLVNILGVYNDAVSNSMLQQYLGLSDIQIKYQSAITLLNNNQLVNVKYFDEIAAEKEFRRNLYDTLVNAGKQRFFPVKYMNQKSLAESDMFNALYDTDDEPDRIVFVTSVTRAYKGETKRFYLYRVEYGSGEGEDPKKSQWLGVAGPYSTDLKKLNTNSEITGIYDTENFDQQHVEQQLDAYLKEMTEAGKED